MADGEKQLFLESEMRSEEATSSGSLRGVSDGEEKGNAVKNEEDSVIVPCRPGVAPIKTRYLRKVLHGVSEKVEEEKDKETDKDGPVNSGEEENVTEQRLSKKRKKRGMNKNRPRYPKSDPSKRLCNQLVQGLECPLEDSCYFSHDIASYMSSKLADIGDKCTIFEKYGRCPYGITCRYGKNHISEDCKNIVNKELYEKDLPHATKNLLRKDLQYTLRKKTYDFPATCCYLAHLETVVQEGRLFCELANLPKTCKPSGALTDEDVIRIRPEEKKKIDFSDKLYLAPLTTVGNLPFRRICKQYGADVTCSEMAMVTNLLQGQQSEWALLKRHSSEDIFGVQVCGAFPDTMARCAELLQNEIEMDFVDVNVGCPIDLVFKKGGGCALMGRTGKFEKIIRGMNHVLDVPLTVKLRAGIFDKKKTWNAHKLIFNLKNWGASLVTLHGRSREQRYTKSADWNYINECAKAAAPMPIFGNGDVLSYEDALLRRQNTDVAGLMIARGAIIKPWIFTEIKEQRHWDISSHERLEMLKEYTKFGLEHWGSDTQGVENTRRFLLEWLSFLNRYIPVGLLERLPQRINERPPPYYGRDDLETIMASPDCADWVKITEILLGPVPPGFTFVPKHRANSFTPTEG